VDCSFRNQLAITAVGDNPSIKYQTLGLVNFETGAYWLFPEPGNESPHGRASSDDGFGGAQNLSRFHLSLLVG
jgi:hypothetical protein